MVYGYNTTNTKSNFQKVIKAKQGLFNRMKRRFNASKNPSERQFLKSECSRICTELKNCCKQWKTCGFGNTTSWIVRNCNMTNFTTKSWTPKTNKTTRKNHRTSNTRSTTSRKTGRTNSRKTTTTNARRNYIAW